MVGSWSSCWDVHRACAALITRQKHKASAYYPSSFPKKKYVDERPRGAPAFQRGPRPGSHACPQETLDSSQQLQAHILAATQNLKSPSRAAQAVETQPGALEVRSEEEEKGPRRRTWKPRTCARRRNLRCLLRQRSPAQWRWT